MLVFDFKLLGIYYRLERLFDVYRISKLPVLRVYFIFLYIFLFEFYDSLYFLKEIYEILEFNIILKNIIKIENLSVY